jgi:elongation factor Ts
MTMLELIKIVRERTGVGPMEARRALQMCANDIESAVCFARENRKMAKENELAAGLIVTHTHNGRIGAMVEVRCGTDFVTRTDEFQALCHELVLQVIGGPGEGALDEQDYIRDPARKVAEVIDECARLVGEKIVVTRYVRWTL